MIEFDNILNQLDRMTKKQWIQLTLLTLPCIVVAMHMGAMVYIGAEQPHTCDIPLKKKLVQTCHQNWTEEQTARYIPWNEDKNSLDTCTRYVFSDVSLDCEYLWPSVNVNQTVNRTLDTEACSSWSYDTTVFTSTVVSEFDLVCSEKYQRRFAQAVFMLGVTVGCVFWGQISDRFGRKLGIMGPMATGLICAVATAFAHTFGMFTALRFFVGFCLFPGFSCAFVLGTETVKPKYRVWVGQTAQAFFAAGFCLLALLGFYIRDWRTLQIVISVPIVIVICSQWFLFESPRWLISSKRYIRAQAIVKQILSSAKNIRSEEAEQLKDIAERQRSYKLERSRDENKEEEEDLKSMKKMYSILDLLRYPNMRKKTLILFYDWMVCSCVYYGLTLNAADLGGDPFINLFLSGLVEIPASYLAVILLEKWGRRPTLTFTLIFSGSACICMILVPNDLMWLNISLSMAGKFNIAAAFGTVYIYAAEIYPTPIRNLGLGVCSGWARIGGILAPFIAMLDAVGKPLPYVVFGSMSIFGGVLALFLPEVLGIKLPETLEESEEFGKDQPFPLSCAYCHGDGRRNNNTQEGANGSEYAKFLNGTTAETTQQEEKIDIQMKM